MVLCAADPPRKYIAPEISRVSCLCYIYNQWQNRVNYLSICPLFRLLPQKSPQYIVFIGLITIYRYAFLCIQALDFSRNNMLTRIHFVIFLSALACCSSSIIYTLYPHTIPVHPSITTRKMADIGSATSHSCVITSYLVHPVSVKIEPLLYHVSAYVEV